MLTPWPSAPARPCASPVRPRGRRSRACPRKLRCHALPSFLVHHESRKCSMSTVTNLGFPRMGARRELKQALEAYWRDEALRPQLLDTARQLRERHWQLQREAGAHVVPCNDFSLYDHV